MRDFFHGWRRKTGVVTLGLACVLMGMWVRGNATGESIALVVGSKLYFISASDFGFECIEAFDPPPTDGLPIWWNHGHIAVSQGINFPEFTMVRTESVIAVQHWSLILPLTLLSAYLLLAPSRKRPPTESQPYA